MSPRLNRIRVLAGGGAKYAVARLRGRNVCTSVSMLVTLRCNRACRYCDFTGEAGEELSTSQLAAMMRALRRQGTVRLGISGGEPLLREDFGEITREAYSLGFITTLMCNGVLLDQWSKEAALLDYVLCTVEGGRAVNDTVRGSGTFDETVRGLEGIAATGHRRLGIVCPVHRGNHEDLDEPLRVAESIGGKAFYQPVQLRAGWQGRESGDVLPDEELRDAFDRIRGWKRAGRAVGNSWYYLDGMVDGFAPGTFDRCVAGRYFFTMLPDGTLLPCCMVSWEQHGVLCKAETLDQGVRVSGKPPCDGCTISPYIENSRLLRPDLPSLLRAARW